MRAWEKSLARASTCDNHMQRESFSARSAPTINLDAWHETTAVSCHHSTPY